MKVPQRLQELAAELDLDLEDRPESSDPQELIAWMKVENDNKRAEENEHRDEIDAEMMEKTDDHP